MSNIYWPDRRKMATSGAEVSRAALALLIKHLELVFAKVGSHTNRMYSSINFSART
jgi:hypothetical protein